MSTLGSHHCIPQRRIPLGASHEEPGPGKIGEVSLCEERAQGPRLIRRAQLTKRFGFYLTNSFAGHIKLLANFLQGVFTPAPDPEPQPDYLLFFRRKRS